MNTDVVKAHKNVTLNPNKRNFEASITVDIREPLQHIRGKKEERFYFHSHDSQLKEWCMILTFVDECLDIAVERCQMTSVDVNDGECTINCTKKTCPQLVTKCETKPLNNRDGILTFVSQHRSGQYLINR